MTETESILSVSALAAGYEPGRVTVQDVTFELVRGERLFVCGANGSGKSCLLRTLAGRLPPRGGELRRLDDGATSAFVPQDFVLEPGLPVTAGEFVRLGLVGLRLGRTERRERVRRALGSMGLGGHERRPFARLSGGERQRTRVARALARGADVLYLDEPTASLDARGEQELHVWLDALVRERRLTLVCVTHALGIARSHADRVALVHEGRVRISSAREAFAGDFMAVALGAWS